jgi:hypothetical protein
VKIGEIWIMKKRILKEYNDAFHDAYYDYPDSREEETEQKDTRVEIVDLSDDKVWFVYEASAQFSSLDREEFVEDYEKVYDE